MTDVDKKEVREDKVKVSDEVIATIAGIAAAEVEGVFSMSGGMVDGISSILGRKNLSKGVKIEAGEKEAIIDLSIIVEYGSRIHQVARKVQDRVRNSIEEMTGLTVVEVNVSILGVNVPKELKKLDAVEESREQ